MGPNNSCLYEKSRLGHRHTEDDFVRTQGEDSRLQAQEIGLRRKDPANTLSWTSGLQNDKKTNFCSSSRPVCGPFLWQRAPTNPPPPESESLPTHPAGHSLLPLYPFLAEWLRVNISNILFNLYSFNISEIKSIFTVWRPAVLFLLQLACSYHWPFFYGWDSRLLPSRLQRALHVIKTGWLESQMPPMTSAPSVTPVIVFCGKKGNDQVGLTWAVEHSRSRVFLTWCQKRKPERFAGSTGFV